MKQSSLSIQINGVEVYAGIGRGSDGPLGDLISTASLLAEIVEGIEEVVEKYTPEEELLALAVAAVIERISQESELDRDKLATLVRQNIAHITD